MAEKKAKVAEPETAITAQTQADRELVAKDFTESMVLRVKEKEKFGLTFPEGYNATNEFMAAMLILQETVDREKKPVLQTCSRESIMNTLLDMATSGLSMQKKQCYPIAYGGKLQLQKSVYGNTCIARRYGMKNINAQCIYQGDVFEYEIVNAEKRVTKHEQNFENINNDKIVGAYAVATMKDGTVITEIMNMAQIKTAWRQGFGYKEGGNGTHQKFTDQMAMKTVKNRLLKLINNTYGAQELDDIDTEDMPTYDERLESDVEYDIEQNANSEEFIVDAEPENATESKSDSEPTIAEVDLDEIDASEAPFM